MNYCTCHTTNGDVDCPLHDGETNEKLRAQVAALRALLKNQAHCGIIYADKPHGFTCLDREAEVVAHPERFGEPLLGELRRHETRCFGCAATELLADTDAARVHDERVRGEERQRMTATLAIVLGCDKWLGSGVVVHENVARAVAEHDAAIRDAALEEAARAFEAVPDGGRLGAARACRALKAVKP